MAETHMTEIKWKSVSWAPVMPMVSLCPASTILEFWGSGQGKEMEDSSRLGAFFKPWHFGVEMGDHG